MLCLKNQKKNKWADPEKNCDVWTYKLLFKVTSLSRDPYKLCVSRKLIMCKAKMSVWDDEYAQKAFVALQEWLKKVYEKKCLSLWAQTTTAQKILHFWLINLLQTYWKPTAKFKSTTVDLRVLRTLTKLQKIQKNLRMILLTFCSVLLCCVCFLKTKERKGREKTKSLVCYFENYCLLNIVENKHRPLISVAPFESTLN